MGLQRLILVAIVALSLTACNPQSSSGGLAYTTAFEYDIPVGKTLPGTDIKYLGKTDQGAQVSISGQIALKRVFDSLTWHSEPAAGVKVDYNLRVISYDADSLKAGGTANINLTSPQPQAIASSSLPKNALTFKSAAAYTVAKSKTIPGTTITYDGKTSDGAKLGGVEGYPFRQEADSITWIGQLADKVFLQLDLRVVFFNDNTLQVTGTATLLLTP
jgi:hypothetical protein